MRRRLLRLGGAALGLFVLGVAFVALHREMSQYTFRQLVESARHLSFGVIAAAGAFTALNYLVLPGYDVLALEHIRKPLHYRKVAVASFVSYALGNNAGGVLPADAFARYRFYSAWGLSAQEITQVVVLCGLALWSGFAALAGTAFILAPPLLPPGWPVPAAVVRPLGCIFLVLAGAYVVISVRPGAALRRWVAALGSEWPRPWLAARQVGLGILDWSLSGAAFYVLLPAAERPGFLHVLGVVLIGHLIGLVSRVPGGIGVFEASVLTLLAPHLDPSLLAGSLVAYRMIYYLAPLTAAALVVAGYEFVQRRRQLEAAAAQIAIWGAALVPPLIATLTFAAGAILLLSGATPAEHGRLAVLDRFLPLPILELSHLAGSIVGAALLILARGLTRRLDAAYHLTVFLLALGVAASLLKGLDVEEALILGGLLAALLPCRRYFYRHASLFRERFTAGWALAIALALGSSIWLGLFAHHHVEYRGEFFWQFTLSGEASRFLRASVGAIGVVFVFAIVRLMRPAAPPAPRRDAAEFERAKELIRASRETYPHLVLLRDKELLWSRSGEAFIAYGVRGKSWIAMGDPVGGAADWPELVWSFRELSDRHDGWAVFFQVSAQRLPLYLEIGSSFLKLGEEALIPLDRFNMEGSERKGLRHTRNKFEREGHRFEVLPPAQVPALLTELRSISDAWLAEKRTREKGFSLGFFDPEYLAQCPLAVVRQGEAVVAFANLWIGAEREELSFDLMRYLPGYEQGVMDFLMVELILWGKQQGYRRLNLGMAPLSGLADRPLAPLWNRLAALTYRHGDLFYGFQGLRQYKEKFDPVWEPKYLASPGGLALPRVLADLAAITSGGLKGVVGR